MVKHVYHLLRALFWTVFREFLARLRLNTRAIELAEF